jgi:hypothetical protein
MPDMATSWHTTNDATFDITGVQLEVGDYPSSFEFRSYGDELRRCQRYCYSPDGNDNSYQYFVYCLAMGNGGYAKGVMYLPTTMRTTPTVTQTHATDEFIAQQGGSTDDIAWSGIWASASGKTSVWVEWNGMDSNYNDKPVLVYRASNKGNLLFTAEL